MLPRDTYSQPAAADPVLDEQTVLALAGRHIPRASHVTGVDESGGEARAYAIDDDVIFKTQRPHRLRPRTSLEKEVFFLNQLAGYPEISVPRVFGYGQQKGIEYICMSRMPGVAAGTVELAGSKRTDLLHEVGRTLRRIHTIAQAPFRESKLFPGPRDYPDFMKRAEAGFSKALSAIAADSQRWMLKVPPEDLARAALAALPATIDLVALHSNPGPEHVFVDPETLRFTGLIDFGDAYIGPPAFDWRWPDPEDRLAVLKGYEQEAPLSKDLLAAWRSTMTLMEMAALASRPERRVSAVDNLAWLSGQLRTGSSV